MGIVLDFNEMTVEEILNLYNFMKLEYIIEDGRIVGVE